MQLQLVNCPDGVLEFERDVVVHFLGVPGTTQSDIISITEESEALERAFVEAYNMINALSGQSCDLFF